jgi:hypothetical protein
MDLVRFDVARGEGVNGIHAGVETCPTEVDLGKEGIAGAGL